MVVSTHRVVVEKHCQCASCLTSGSATECSRILFACVHGARRSTGNHHKRAWNRHPFFHIYRSRYRFSDLFSPLRCSKPIQNAIEALGNEPIEVASTLRAGPWDTFFNIVLPLAKPGFITAAVLGFAHTVGEFGVVLMIGGNIPGVTQVLSVQIYEHVEALDYPSAHTLAALMLFFSFVVLAALYSFNKSSTTKNSHKNWLR